MCPLFRTFFIKCMQFLCASVSPDSEKVKGPSSSASQLQINGLFPGHEGQNKVENTYFWANTLEETLHRMYPVFWEHVSSSSSLKGAHCLPLCFQGLLTNVRFKSHVITGTRDGVSATGFCAPVRWFVWERWPEISSREHPRDSAWTSCCTEHALPGDGVIDYGCLPSS